MILKPSHIKPEHRDLIKKIKPYVLAVQLQLLRVMGLFYKGHYSKYGVRDPDFNSLNNKVYFIMSLARSGTTALYELFNSHKDVYAYNEVLSTGTFYNYFDFVERCAAVGVKTARPDDRLRLFKWYVFNQARKRGEKVVVYDIKLELMHLINNTWQPTVWQSALFEMIKRDNIGVLYLYRKNLLERYISSERARQTGTYHQYGNTDKFKNFEVVVDTRGIIDKFDIIEKTREFITSEMTDQVCFCEINYEDLFSVSRDGKAQFNPKIIETLCKHFSVSADFDVEPRTRKVSQKGLFDGISNADEVISALTDTPYKRFLPEQ